MRFSLLTIGKPKYSFWREAEEHYCKSINTLGKVELISLKEQDSIREKEWQSLFGAFKKRAEQGACKLVLLDESGKQFDSIGLSKHLKKWEDQGIRDICFAIGGAYGFLPENLKEADLILSLGKLTLPHDLARVVMLEQLYRALHIQGGTKYHHV